MSDLLPQLETATYSSQIFWLFITFWVLYFAFSKMFLPNIKNLVDRRRSYINSIDDQITNKESDIKSLTAKHDSLLKESQNQALEIIKSGRKIVSDMNLESQESVKTALNALDNDLENDVRNALDLNVEKMKSDSHLMLKELCNKLSLKTDNLETNLDNIFSKIWLEKFNKKIG
jgi:F-type H+-transporting ATPase subunit b